MKIFLDDLRPVPDEFDLVFRSGKALLKYLKENPNQHYELISLVPLIKDITLMKI